MAVLTYNEVSLPFCDVTSFRMEAVHDEQAQVDKVLTKFDISTNCLITSDAIDMIFPDLHGLTDDPAVIMAYVQEQLMYPRRNLSFKFNDFEFVTQPTLAGFVDAKNGPQPQSCVMTRMDERSWLVQYHIIAHYVVNYKAARDGSGRFTMTNLPGNTVLFNRWEEKVSIDAMGFSTRTRSGKCMIRSDNSDGFTADQVRSQMAVVSIPQGFLRDDAEYTVSPDGLGLAYRVVDKEVFRMPPGGNFAGAGPAFRAEGEYVEELTKGNGIRYGRCRCKLYGSKAVTQAKLIRTAVAVVSYKLANAAAPAADVQKDPGFFQKKNAGVIIRGHLSHGLYDNWVEAELQVMFPASKDRMKGVSGPHPSFGTVNYSTGFGPNVPYNDRGTASLLLQAAAYYDNTIQGVKLGAGKSTTDDNPATPQGDGALQLDQGTQIGRGGLEGT